MKLEEYGKDNSSIIVMLHGTNFVHCYGRQYPFAEHYHIIVPHIMGFGDEAEKVFDTELCVSELAAFIKSLNKKVLLIGFSLGAQLAFKLISEYPDLFYSAIIVSPWLNKAEPELSEVLKKNEKQFYSLRKKWLCNLIGIMNGLPSAQRKEFVNQMQNVKIETVRNSVNNGITFGSVAEFADVAFPVVALAGGKEQKSILESVKKMSEVNQNCRYEIWDKAAHNIPPMFSKRFNKLISETAL